MQTPRKTGSLPGSSGGFTIVELLIVLGILTITISMLSNLFVASSRMVPVHRETARAVDAARNRLEALRNVPLGEVWSRFNADPADDPGGPGTAEGNRFIVSELIAVPGVTDGTVGQVDFPAVNGILREDADLPEFGLPRDLNGDGEIDAESRAGDYIVLPVRVRVDWKGVSGERSFEIFTMLSDL